MSNTLVFKQPTPVVAVPELQNIVKCGVDVTTEKLLRHQTITNQYGVREKTQNIASAINEKSEYPEGVKIATFDVPKRVSIKEETINTNSVTYKYGHSDVGSYKDDNQRRLLQRGIRDKSGSVPVKVLNGNPRNDAGAYSGYMGEEIKNKTPF